MSLCKECGSKVSWKRESGSGKMLCLNADGSDHWDLCSKLRWEATKRTGERFENELDDKGNTVSGYRNSVHGTKLSHILAVFVTRPTKPIIPCGHDDCPPPWEVCHHKCPNEMASRRGA